MFKKMRVSPRYDSTGSDVRCATGIQKILYTQNQIQTRNESDNSLCLYEFDTIDATLIVIGTCVPFCTITMEIHDRYGYPYVPRPIFPRR